MTPREAIERLQKRESFLAEKISKLQAEGRNVYWFEKDAEANTLAISALEYLHQVQDYEASQKQL
jgi:hypothetical protein